MDLTRETMMCWPAKAGLTAILMFPPFHELPGHYSTTSELCLSPRLSEAAPGLFAEDVGFPLHEAFQQLEMLTSEFYTDLYERQEYQSLSAISLSLEKRIVLHPTG